MGRRTNEGSSAGVTGGAGEATKEQAKKRDTADGMIDGKLGGDGGGTAGANDEAMAGREVRARVGSPMDLGGKTNERIGAATDLSTIRGATEPQRIYPRVLEVTMTRWGMVGRRPMPRVMAPTMRV
jgi:hypothetical protein